MTSSPSPIQPALALPCTECNPQLHRRPQGLQPLRPTPQGPAARPTQNGEFHQPKSPAPRFHIFAQHPKLRPDPPPAKAAVAPLRAHSPSQWPNSLHARPVSPSVSHSNGSSHFSKARKAQPSSRPVPEKDSKAPRAAIPAPHAARGGIDAPSANRSRSQARAPPGGTGGASGSFLGAARPSPCPALSLSSSRREPAAPQGGRSWAGGFLLSRG